MRTPLATQSLGVSLRPFSRSLARFLSLASILVVQACAPTQLSHVFVGERSARPAEVTAVQVIRGGQIQATRVAMELQPGDEIATDASTTAVISFASGAEAILKPESRVRLASLELIFGEVLIILERIEGYFEVKTEDVTAGAGSTAYFVSRGKEGPIRVTVLEGPVDLKSPQGRWAPRSLDSRQRATVRAGGSPRVRVLPKQEYNLLIAEANRLEKLIRPEDGRFLLPNVLGLLEGTAGRVLGQAGFGVGRSTRRITGKSPIGTVVGQTPPPGARVPQGTAVDIEVEAEPAEVPSLIGEPQFRAETALRQRGLNRGRVVRRITGRAEPETVIEQTPVAGTVVPKGSAVNLVVEAESVIVPSLEGSRLEDAKRRLRNERLRVGSVRTQITGRVGPGFVLEQGVRGGRRVSPGTRVDLVTEAESVIIPNVEGLHVNDARNRLANARLSVGRVSERITGRTRPRMVLDQQPDRGKRVAPGTRVDLVTEAESVIIPNVEGLHINDARIRLTNARLGVGRVSDRITGRTRPGMVLDQQPGGGNRVAPGTRVDLVTEAPSVLVPSLQGLSLDRARSVIVGNNLTLGRVRDELTDRFRSRTVTGQTPSPQTRVKPGTRVDLTIAIEGRRVPSLVGRSEYQAGNILSRRGLRLGRRTYVRTGKYSPGSIVHQRPPAGRLVRPGTYVDIDVEPLQRVQ